jgi:hypothetical protein
MRGQKTALSGRSPFALVCGAIEDDDGDYNDDFKTFNVYGGRMGE